MLTHRLLSSGLILAVLCSAAASEAFAQRRGGGGNRGGSSGFRFGGSGGGISIGGSGFRLNIPQGPPVLGGGVMQNRSSGINSNSNRNFRSFAPNQAGNNGPRVNLGGAGFQNFNSGFGNQGFGGQPAVSNFGPSQNFASPGFSQFSSTQSPSAPPMLAPQFSNQPIRIQLPTDSVMPVNYLLNEWDYSMTPGQAQSLVEDREWVIRFDRGRGFGTTEYALAPGTYRFVREEDSGWQLYQVPEDAPTSSQTPPPPPQLPGVLGGQ
ncbi:MAG: hypothetical protein IT428_11120 [Planctomycetaceae bacterium]|nr:hypothetical protein [Planctomycetaceae bacterium]